MELRGLPPSPAHSAIAVLTDEARGALRQELQTMGVVE